MRDHLGMFGFEGDRAFVPVERFSGGEKARLELFDGDLDDYQQSSRVRSQTAPAAPIKETPRRAPRAAAKGGSKSRGRLGELRREIEQIEQRIAAVAEERALVEAELCKNPMHVGLQAQHAEPATQPACQRDGWMWERRSRPP
ncbi:MAG TPA: hypothetical protein VII35_11540 [Steroidobacteraceae bacterium]